MRISILGTESIVVGYDYTKEITKEILETVKSSTYIIISDSNLNRLNHVKSFENQLTSDIANLNASSRVLTLIIPPTEIVKTRETKEQIENWLLDKKCTRDSCLIALGGGVIGDMIGFVASTFMRGIPIIQIPTTLLAMVDSSVGGKTAVDTPHGKNLIGSFHQPTRIFIDTKYLRTLPKREFSNGMAEVIKTACIWDEKEFEFLENNYEKILAFSDGSLVNDETSQILVKAILGSVKVKAHVVTVDEKESGLRGLLNFGHSIGHAFEAILTPQVLHGECVSIGMVKEAEIACHLGHLKEVNVGRLSRCLKSYDLPISIEDKMIKNVAPHKSCPVEKVLDIMRIDKKNQGNEKRIVLLSGIGKTFEQKASFVSDEVIRKILSPAVIVVPPEFPHRVNQLISLNVPGSKSISNRALLLAALGDGPCRLSGLLHSDDVQVMLSALQKLIGITFCWEDDGETLLIHGNGGNLRTCEGEIYLGNAGTASRFLTSVCSLIKVRGSEQCSDVILTGNARMKQRPIAPLVDALVANGAKISYLGNEGALPLQIKAETGLLGGTINLSASISSQYVSSILMSAPYAVNPVTLILTGNAVVSQPYIDMTISMMKSFGIEVVRDSEKLNTYHIPKGVYRNPAEYLIEADASSATYPLAFAAVTGSTVKVMNIGFKSLQGDAEFAVKVLRVMGCRVEQTETTTTVQGPVNQNLKPIKSIDMETLTDAFLTASVIAPYASSDDSSTRIFGIENQRVKECDRIAAMVEQLSRFGVKCKENPDGLTVEAIDGKNYHPPTNGGVFCYDDHRVAMSFSIFVCGLRDKSKKTIILEKKCVDKTWPGWWNTLENVLGVNVIGVDLLPETNLKSVDYPVKFNKSIILIGMRGAGKTHAGKFLAKSLKRKFIDLDEYLENYLKCSIPFIISSKGWEYFRQQELAVLQKVLSEYQHDAIIATGGGIVETVEARELLKSSCGKPDQHNSKSELLDISDSKLLKFHVIHIKRSDMQQVFDYLSEDKSRPAFTNDLMKVWNTRKEWYEDCSSSEFIIVKEEHENWRQVERDLLEFVKFITGLSDNSEVVSFPGLNNLKDPSFFLSLTFKNFEKELKNLQIERFCDGLNLLELRIDLLESMDLDFIGKQLFILRRLLKRKIPVLFTIRTINQGGKYDDQTKESLLTYFKILSRSLKWGVEYLDVEILNYNLSENCHSIRTSMAETIISNKNNTKILASFHDCHGSFHWVAKSSISHKSDRFSLIEVENSFGFVFEKLRNSGADIIKLIGTASSINDNFDLKRFVDFIVPRMNHSNIPLIALNMGMRGQLSRCLNHFLTPVTHKDMPFAAAPGQLSISEINETKKLIGLLSPKRFSLIGYPISRSLSPLIHNTGFQVLGLPHHYELNESKDFNEVVEKIKIAFINDYYGGSSVTIPYKESVLNSGLLNETSEAVKLIGACNTIIPKKNEKGDSILYGENTDWKGITVNFEKILENSNVSANEKRIGIVIGAGGTARAAAYSLYKLNCTEIRIYNRTFEKAELISKEFNLKVNENNSSLRFHAIKNTAELFKNDGNHNDGKTRFLIVSTIPGSAQEETNFKNVFASLKSTAESESSSIAGGILIDMAYLPKQTEYLKFFKILSDKDSSDIEFEKCEGLEVLLTQAYEQFFHWTGFQAPEFAIRNTVLNNE
ncbi:3-dehydroquinate dehydratase (3-dehydroquinase) [Lobulomyces angularis]|nr:3-dehydroquinate dehydratase (3-dehydroquinase) [Lobulomyces angularis]